MDLQNFHNIHKGETCLLVGNGENLHKTPPAWFDYPAFGMNTIFRYAGWKPDYYVAVDQRIYRDFQADVEGRYGLIPKFFPTPHLDAWQTPNTYRFNHLAHTLWDEKKAWSITDLQSGFAYHSVMHAAMQIAAYMGFTTLLMIGVEHKPGAGREHFWGTDERMPEALPVNDWLKGYAVLAEGMKRHKITVLNISEDTYVEDSIIPRADWRDYAKG